MPLSLVKTGENALIKRIGGRAEQKKRLESLGFVAGGSVTVVSEMNGSVIVNIKDSRVAISREMANSIIV